MQDKSEETRWSMGERDACSDNRYPNRVEERKSLLYVCFNLKFSTTYGLSNGSTFFSPTSQ